MDAGHGDVDGALEFGAQVALGLDLQFAAFEQHEEAAVRARNGEQAVQGLLQQIVQLHLGADAANPQYSWKIDHSKGDHKFKCVLVCSGLCTYANANSD